MFIYPPQIVLSTMNFKTNGDILLIWCVIPVFSKSTNYTLHYNTSYKCIANFCFAAYWKINTFVLTFFYCPPKNISWKKRTTSYYNEAKYSAFILAYMTFFIKNGNHIVISLVIEKLPNRKLKKRMWYGSNYYSYDQTQINMTPQDVKIYMNKTI